MGAANFAFSAPGRKWQGFETLPFPYTSTFKSVRTIQAFHLSNQAYSNL